MTEHSDRAEIPVQPPLLFGVPLVLTIAFLRRRPPMPLPRSVRRAAGVSLTLAGTMLSWWAVVVFLQARENPEVHSPTTQILRTGPYAFSRNPIYLGLALGYAGLGLIANSLATLVSLPFVTWLAQQLVIEREEAYLRAKFGREYDRYRDEVRRWL